MAAEPAPDSPFSVSSAQRQQQPQHQPREAKAQHAALEVRFQEAKFTRVMAVGESVLNKIRPANSPIKFSFEMLLLAAVVYGVLVYALGEQFLPGHAPFATLVIWIVSVSAAELANWFRIPRVVGMLGAGIMLANLPQHPIAAFPAQWGKMMRAAALATIFLRCGLELEFKTMRLYKWPALRLALLPGLLEAVFDAGIASAVFGMPYTLGLAMGFILKAVGPGLVVPAMFQLQKLQLGARQGIPSTVVIAASFDDIVAITGFSIFISIAVAGQSDAAWQIASGPLQVIFGIIGGIICGVILGCTKIFNNVYKRILGLYGSCLLLMFFLFYYDMLSGGALGSLTVGLVTCLMWESGKPHALSLGSSNNYSTEIERVMSKIWNWVMEPMLFATIGTSIIFSTLPSATIPKSILVVVTGVSLRVVATFFTMSGLNYSLKERIFFAMAWTPKATVQASLAAVPLSLITTYKPGDAQWKEWGQDILTTGVFAIIICGSLGMLLIYFFAPVLLSKDTDELAIDGDQVLSRRSSLGDRPLGPKAPRSRSLHAALSQRHHSGDVLKQLETEYDVIDQYFDTIDQLTQLVRAEAGGAAVNPDAARTLTDKLEALQERIETDVGPSELTVRQMLHQAALQARLLSNLSTPGGGAGTSAAAQAADLKAACDNAV